jgi:predicted AAA+ superfamily ATPase
MAGGLYRREHYLAKIRPFYEDNIIKVISGVRRCGKSCLMQTIAEELKGKGIAEKDIIYIDLDKREFRKVKTTDQLENAIDSRILDDDFKYLFIDEIQNVDGYEEVINGFNTDGGCSIFITGSNSYLLSGELATKLTGRHIEFDLFTLSFSEYLGMLEFLGKQPRSIAEEFEAYLRYGGFPKSLEYDDVNAKTAYIESVVRQIIEKDIKGRRKIRNVSVFNRVMSYMINNFGAATSITNLVTYFRDVEKVPIKREMLADYIKLLENAKVLYRCQRFDLKSRKSLRGEAKYYLADPGIYLARNTDVRTNYGPSLENVLYTYLRSCGYAVSVGRIGNLEIDFITRKRDEYAYIQVSMSIADKSVEDREYRPFVKTRDNYPQYLFTLDPLTQKRDGVKHINLINFLSSDSEV